MITQQPAGLGVSEHKDHKGGMVAAYILALFRTYYTFDKRDPEFRNRSPEFFEGKMKLYLGWFSMGWLTGVDYRVTAEDNGDGSTIHRYTWKDQKHDEPAAKSKQFHEYK